MTPGIDSQAKRTDAYCVAKKADEHYKRKLTQITEETGADAQDRRKISCGNGWVSQKGSLFVWLWKLKNTYVVRNVAFTSINWRICQKLNDADAKNCDEYRKRQLIRIAKETDNTVKGNRCILLKYCNWCIYYV